MTQTEERYYKGIYPVEIVPDASESTNRGEIKIRVKHRFLLTSNYSDEKHWVKPGETLNVPAKLVWQRRRDTPKGHI
jgi:hypothetical protein